MRPLKMVCALLALLLALPGGVAAAEGGQGAMGRYVETPIELPMEDVRAFAQADGAIYAVNGSGDALLKGRDLSDMEWLQTGHDEAIAPAQGGVNWMAVGADGALYLGSGWAMADEQRRPFIERIKGGKAERIQLDQRFDAGSDQLAMCMLPTGEMLGLDYMKAYRFSADGKVRQTYEVSGGASIAAHGQELAICSLRDSLISVLDIESGHVLRTLPLPGPASYGVVGYDGSGALYYVCPDGLYQANAGGTLLIQVADGRFMTASKPDAEARALLFDADNNPLVAYSRGGIMSLVAYHYDESVPTEPGAVLSVYALYDNKTLRECASQFQQQYPEAMVDLIVAQPEGGAITRDDAIRTLNTELLAGKGPDVIVLDGLPVQSYLDKGVLQDLSSVVRPLLDSGALLGNIAGAFQAGDAIPAVPTRFLLPSLWGDVEGMNTIEDMAEWAQANMDAPAAYTDVESLIGTFYPSCAPAWFTQDGRLDEAAIEQFLTAMKAIRAPSAAAPNPPGAEQAAFTWEWNPYRPSGMDQTDEEARGCDNFNAGIQKQLPFLLRGVDSATYPNGAMKSNQQGGFAALPGQAEGCFVPMLVLGANKGAANGELALKFIQFSLGEDSQNSDLMEGFQVNVKALDAAQGRGETLFGMFGTSAVGSDLFWHTTWLDPDQQKQLRAMIEALKTPVIPDFTLYEMMVKEAAPFFEGQMDAKQAAANVCAKANAYLSE